MPHYPFSLLLAMCLTFSLPSLSAQEQSANNSQDTLLARQLLDTAQIRMNAGKYQDAIKYIDSAGILYERTLGKESGKYSNFLTKKGEYFYYTGEYDLALDFTNQALQIRLSVLGTNHLAVAASYNSLGIFHWLKGNFDDGIFNLNKALQIRLKSFGEEHPVIADVYQNLGGVYYDKGYSDSSAYYYKKALQIQLKSFGEEHPRVADSYNGIGASLSSVGEYNSAIPYFEKALQIYKKYVEDNPAIGDFYNNIGIIYAEKGAYDQAISYYHKALQIRLKFFGEEHPKVGELYNNLAISYDRKLNYDRAIYYNEKALQIIANHLGGDHFSLGDIYLNLGIVYSRMSNYDLSISCYEKAVQVYQKAYGTESPTLARTYNSLGKVYYKKNDISKAIPFYEKAITLSNNLINTSQSYRDIGDCFFYKKGDFDQAISYYNKAISLTPIDNSRFEAAAASWKNFRTLGNVYLAQFKKTKKQELLTQAQAFLLKSIQTIDHLRTSFNENSAKESLLQNTYPVYEGMLMADLWLFQETNSSQYLQEAFHFTSRAKSQLLYEALQEADALRFARLPDSLLEQENDLRLNITYLEKRKQNLLNSKLSETDSTVLTVNAKLFDLKQQYEMLKKRFETDYPDYYRLKYDLRTVSAEEVQRELLQPEQVLVEYFVGDSSIFMFVLRPDTLIVHDVKKDFPLEAWVNQLREGLFGYHSAARKTDALYEKTVRQYAEVAHQLYQKLIAPLENDLRKDLIIIPDGILGYIPFEALLSAAPKDVSNPGSYPYLLRKHQISYCYSSTLLREMQEKKKAKEPTETLLAVAPFYSGDTTLLTNLFAYDETTRKDLSPLQHSGEEVYRISKLWKGNVLTGAAATEEKFTSQAGNYQILHLATHGRADERVGDYSFLAFSEIKDSVENELLYVRDLYNMQLNADLVVLSACETGLGKLSRGEGIISLARAFAYAGAKSIVTTLWSVDDAKTKDVMVQFYQHLKKGASKNAALHQAKLDYLKTHASPADAHPYYWAGFVPIGDMRALR